MLLREFPDLKLVRQLKSNAASCNTAWRNVVLNFSCAEASRLNLDSPYSFFLNRSGHSHCSVNNRHYRVETDRVLFSQPGDIYGLTIDNLHRTEICNIHITKNFFEEAAYAAITNDEKLLDNPGGSLESILLHSQLYRRDEQLNTILNKLAQPTTFESNMFESVLADLVTTMIARNEDIARRISNMPFARPSVRADIYRRLTIARDHLHSNYQFPPDLEALSREAAMSKFHLLRAFKTHFGVSPYRYLAQLRMEKAAQLLKDSKTNIYAVAEAVGYEEPNSFIKAFSKAHGISPLKFRSVQISNPG